MSLISAATIVIDGRICRPGWLATAGRRIVGCAAGRPPRPADVDLPDAIVVPGFVDIHVHGGGGASYTAAGVAEIGRAAEFHLRHGTTTTLASLVTTSPAELLTGVRALAEAARLGTIAGIHLEGPWLSPARCGAHDSQQLRNPDSAEIDEVLAAGDGALRMVTLAPELPGSAAAITRFLAAGVVVAVGHTNATYEQTRHAVELGATIGTHLFNAMRPLHQREPGPALALLQDPRVTVELITDGVHVHPALIDSVIEMTGPQRVAAVTDAIAAAGVADGSCRLGPRWIDVVAGVARVRATPQATPRATPQATPTIAGSTATMDQLFGILARREAAPNADAALAAAVQMTSTTPARALGMHRVGGLRAGADANLVVLDGDLRLTAVMANGDWRVGPAPTRSQ